MMNATNKLILSYLILSVRQSDEIKVFPQETLKKITLKGVVAFIRRGRQLPSNRIKIFRCHEICHYQIHVPLSFIIIYYVLLCFYALSALQQ